MRRAVVVLLVVVLLGAGAGLGAAGWHYSDELLLAPTGGGLTADVEVLDVDPEAGVIELDATSGDLVELATTGLLTEDGLLLLEDPDPRPDRVILDAEVLDGQWPRPGDRGAVTVDTFRGDPAATLGLPFETVDVAGQLGDLPAWRVVPPRLERADPWVVIVHGRGATRAQGNRVLNVTADLGLPTLLISVRNDPDAPVDPDGFGRYGDTEWEDLQAAISHLSRVEDADRFLLVGHSQGASTVMSFLRRSPDAGRVEAAIMISPLLSLHETLEMHAEQRGIPGQLIPPVLSVTRWIATQRSGIRFEHLEHLDGLDELPDDLPMLVTHGDRDAIVPVGPTRALAESLPDTVSYEEFRAAGHLREWNADRQRFERVLREFLAELEAT